MMNKLIIVTCLAVTLTIGSIASAFPSWRGSPGSTYQEWEFDSAALQPVPDFVNPYGDPQLRVTPFDGWIQDPGAWAMGEIDVMIPNSNVSNPEKWIQIQLMWKVAGNDPFLPDGPLIGITGIAPSMLYTIVLDPRIDDQAGDWINSTYNILIQPNPFWEWIAIKGDIMVDQLIIDTRCVPEPTTICLLGLGTLTLLRRKRGYGA